MSWEAVAFEHTFDSIGDQRRPAARRPRTNSTSVLLQGRQYILEYQNQDYNRSISPLFCSEHSGPARRDRDDQRCSSILLRRTTLDSRSGKSWKKSLRTARIHVVCTVLNRSVGQGKSHPQRAQQHYHSTRPSALWKHVRSSSISCNLMAKGLTGKD